MTKTQEELDTELEQLRDRTQVLEEKRLMAPTEGKVKNINDYHWRRRQAGRDYYANTTDQ